MLLSSNVIKQVSRELEGCPVYPKIAFRSSGEEKHIHFELESVKKEADSILVKARSEAEKMLQETNHRITVLEQETYANGYRKGEQDARFAAQRAQEEFYASTRTVLQEIEEIRGTIIQNTEKELVQLAVDIAEKLVCRQLDINPETIVDIVKAASQQVRECKQVIVYVTPAHMEAVKAKQTEIAAQLYYTNRIKIIADASVKSGGCRIETEQGYIDATVATMLNQLDTLILGNAI